ncbi:MAG TPA: helix-turn-helix domain-containing protein [Blastocatellia bacterium]|nr:helix-turn-helix domain-containing protein [Blastocatellia bacterium]
MARSEADRLRAENHYLLSRFVEITEQLEAVVDRFNMAVGRLQEIITPITFPKLLTDKEVAALYGVSDRTVKDWVQKGRIPFHKIGATVRFRLDELLQSSQVNSDTGTTKIVRLPRSKRLQPGKEQKHAS